MRFLYVAPRYHTNQIPIMKGLKEQGHQVYFFSHYKGRIEDYSYVIPEIIGYSPLFLLMEAVYIRIHEKKNPMAGDWKLLHGFPPILKMYCRIKKVHPDIVIIRERSVYSIVTYLICRMLKMRAILYNQSPVCEERKSDMAHKLVKRLTPRVRMTPVLGMENEDKKRIQMFFLFPLSWI